MNTGKTLFAQLMDFLPWTTFTRIVDRYGGDHRVRTLSCAEQYRSMAFAQLTYRESLRDIETCLSVHASKLYHMGFRQPVRRSTLADANERRDWRIHAALAQRLITQARTLYVDEELGLGLSVGAPDQYRLRPGLDDHRSCVLSVFPWAHFRTSTKAAVKMHTLLDLRGNIPSFIHISDGKLHDVHALDMLLPEAGAIYVVDRGYVDFARLYVLHQAGANLLSPHRCRRRGGNPHDGEIITHAPNLMWGTDGVRVFTVDDGWGWIFTAVEHWNAECVGWHVCKRGDRFAALQPISMGLAGLYGSTAAGAARGLALRMDHGSQYLSDHFTNQIKFWGIQPSYAFSPSPRPTASFTRAKSNIDAHRVYSAPTDRSTGIICDQTISLDGFYTRQDYPELLRRIRFKDPESGKTLVFITNNFSLPAATICALYKSRWQVELFFKWIKQHLRIKQFYGTSENAVKTQIWIAVSVYVLVAILKKRLDLDASLYTLLQILSVTLFEKMPIHQALAGDENRCNASQITNQLNLFDF